MGLGEKSQDKTMPNQTGSNSAGNDYTSRDGGDFSYQNADGSGFYQDGHHQHYCDGKGGGWHYNENTDTYSSGQNFRDTNGSADFQPLNLQVKSIVTVHLF